MKAMILAAGRGERMRPLTDTTPKPLLNVGGRPLIDHHLAALTDAGITEVVINLCWLGEQIREYVGDGARYGAQIHYSDESPAALETGGGIHKALPLLGEAPFWLVNGDVYCQYCYDNRTLPAGITGHLVMVPNPPHNRAGDFCLEDRLVRTTGDQSLTYSGIAVLAPELFANCAPGKFPLAPILSEAAEHSALSGELFNGTWHDIGTPQRLAALGDELEA